MVALIARVGHRSSRDVILGFLVAGCAATPPPEPTREDILQRIIPATVQVVVEQQEGRRLRSSSGVAIASRASAGVTECFILTSGHAVTGLQKHGQVYVFFGRHLGEGVGTKVPATVLGHREAKNLDLAILRAESEWCVPARLGSPPTLGASVWVVGFPWGRHMTLASGIVSQINLKDIGDFETSARLMVDASVSYGVSGGGVFDARSGGLIGLVEGYRTARVTSHGTGPAWYIDVPEPGQTFVTPLIDIRRFLAQTGHAGLVRD